MQRISKHVKPQVDLSKLSLEGISSDSNLYNVNTVKKDPVEEIRNIIKSCTGITSNTKEKLEKIEGEEGKLALSLYQYEISMNRNKSKDLANNVLGSNNYNLYNKLIQVINAKEYENFVPLFDIVNFFFTYFKDSSFSEFALNRADLYFAGDRKQLRTYQRLITLICILCVPSTRVKNKHFLSTQAVFDRNVTVFTEQAISNIRKYYGI